MNSITASGCDIVLSSCPLSVLKYKEKGFESYFIPFENGKFNKNNDNLKEIDVLFFGELTFDRIEFLTYITDKGINLKNVGFNPGDKKILSDEKLTELISKSKIVLNLSKSKTLSLKNYSSENIYKYYYQWKGRVWDAALNGVLCVSEYSPAQEIFFKEDEIPSFYTKDECVKILKHLLKNDGLLAQYTKKFTSKAFELCEDKKNFEPIYKSLEKLKHRRVALLKIPYWYLRIVNKQIILRNIKISNLFKTILQLKLVFLSIKNYNFFIKILVVFETLINVLWYSLVLTIKPKK